MRDRLVYRVNDVGIYFHEIEERRLPPAAETLRRQLGGFESSDEQGVRFRVIVDDYARLSPDRGVYRAAPGYAYADDGLFVAPGEQFAVRVSGTTLQVWAGRKAPVTATYLLQMLLLPFGMTFVHAAGISVQGKAVLFPAFGGVGKTALIAQVLRRPEVRLLGDDYVIVAQDGSVRGFPAPFTLYPYHRQVFPAFFRTSSLRILPGTLPFRAARRALDAVGLWSRLEAWLPVEYAVVPVRSLYPPERLESSAVPVHAVHVMQRVQGLVRPQVRPVTLQEVSMFIANVLLYEWHPLARMLAARLTLRGEAVSGYLRRVQTVIAGALRGVDVLRVIELPLELSLAEAGEAVIAASLADESHLE